jgi:hypothetical protein
MVHDARGAVAVHRRPGLAAELGTRAHHAAIGVLQDLRDGVEAHAFLPVDVRDGQAEEERGQGCLTAGMIVSHLAGLRSLRAMLPPDTCCVRAFDVIALRREEPMAGRLRHGSRRFMLTAATRLQPAPDGRAGRPGRPLDAVALGLHLRERVPAMALERRFEQRAVFILVGKARPFPVAARR